MTTSVLNWRELKKELFTSPRPRTSLTYQHTDIFGAISTPEEQKKNNPTNQQGIGRSSHKTPKRVRENDSTRSFVLNKSDAKVQRSDKSHGKKTFKSSDSITILRENVVKSANPHRIPDHKNEWFFDHKINKPEAAALQLSTVKSNYQTCPQDREMSPHKLKKQEELYKTELSQTQILNPDGSKLNLLPRRKSESQRSDLDRQNSQQRNATEMRLKHNESNVLNSEEFQSKLNFPLQPYKKNKNDQKIQSNEGSKWDLQEMNRIKRLNHNFSDVFGLEYGAREGVQNKKQQNRHLSTKLDWTNVDSILNEKDIGIKNKGAPTVLQQIQLLLDQKSTLDTHDHYDKPIPKQQKIVPNKGAVQRDNQKKKSQW